MKKRQKARSLSPRGSQIIVTKEKEGRKRKGEEKNSKIISNLGPLRKKSRMTKDVSIKLTGDRGRVGVVKFAC